MKDVTNLNLSFAYTNQEGDKGMLTLAEGIGHMTKLTKLKLNFTQTKVTDVGFEKLIGKLREKNITHLILIFGATKIKKDMGIINLAPVLQDM